MDIPALNPQAKASVVPFDQLAKNPNVSQGDKLKEACRQFEAILLRQILGEARKSASASTADAKSSVSGIYDDMVNNQLADNISRSGAFGLAKSLETQLSHQVLPHAKQSAAKISSADSQTHPPTKS
jgi:Rod binding domain-containing protein